MSKLKVKVTDLSADKPKTNYTIDTDSINEDALIGINAVKRFFKSKFKLDFCEKCFQMTNHLNSVCQKCLEEPLSRKTLVINVEKINGIEPHCEQRRPFTQDINTTIEPHQLQALFYKIWAEVGDDILKEWVGMEGYQLIKLGE